MTFILRVLEGGLCAATVLVSFGVLIGKINPLQLLILGLIETVLFVANCHVGYSMFGAVDVGRGDFAKTDCSQKRIFRLRMGG